MSVKATNFVRRLRGLTITEKAVAMILADHDSHKGEGSFPGMTTVADESCLKNRQTATDVVKRLTAKGVITTDSLSRGERGKTTVYRFNYTLTNCNPEVTLSPDNCNPRIAVSHVKTATLTPVNCNPAEAKLQPCNPETATGELHEGVEGVKEKEKKEEAVIPFSAARAEELTELVTEIASDLDRNACFTQRNVDAIRKVIEKKQPTEDALGFAVREITQACGNSKFLGDNLAGGLAARLRVHRKLIQRNQDNESQAKNTSDDDMFGAAPTPTIQTAAQREAI